MTLTQSIKILSLFLLTFAVGNNFTFAQAPERISSQGKIPSDFLISSTKKYQEKLDQYERSEQKRDNRKTKKSKDKFYLQSSFDINDILKSGEVLFNDELSIYVNKVFNQLNIDEKLKKKKKPRIYIVNSNEVNAFATEQGIIFVTVGLLANIESESQLAFILAHELAHIEENHVIDKFLKTEEYGSQRDQWLDNLKDKESIFSEAVYSRSLEKEADSLGLQLFFESDYGHDDLDQVFTTLYYSYLSYSEKSFERSFFEDKNYQFPDELWLETVNDISPMDDDNEESTHPSAASRMEHIKRQVSKHEHNHDTPTLDGKDFQKYQDLARYQLPYICIEQGQNIRAIYNCFILLNKYPEDSALKKLVATALYMEAKKQRSIDEDEDGNSSDFMLYGNIDEMEGAMHRIGHLFKEMTTLDFTVLALKNNYERWLEDKEDVKLDMAVNSLMLDLASEVENLDGFNSTPLPADVKVAEDKVKTTQDTIASANVNEKKEEKELSRKEKIEKANAKASQLKEFNEDSNTNFSSYAFVDYLEDEDFQERFKKAKKQLKKYDKEDEEDESVFMNFNKNIVKDPVALNKKKVVVVNPKYIAIGAGYNGQLEYLLSEEKSMELADQIVDIGKKSKLKVELLNVASLNENDSDTFNKLIELEKYLSEQLFFPSKGLHPSSNQNKINEIADELGTDYFLWTGMISKETAGVGALYTWMIVIPPYLNSIVFDTFVLNAVSFQFAILCDVRTGKRQVIKLDSASGKYSKRMLDAHLYDIFNQISSKE